MARLFSTISDTATYFKKATHVTPLNYAIELFALGSFGRNQYLGGNQSGLDSLDCTTAGDQDLKPASLRFKIDNSNSQITNSASVVVQVRFYLRVSDAGVSLTPKILKSTDDATYTAASYTGALACTGTATDFSGTNQKQTLTLTLDAGVRYYRPQVTVGAGGTGIEGWAYALLDVYCAV